MISRETVARGYALLLTVLGAVACVSCGHAGNKEAPATPTPTIVAASPVAVQTPLPPRSASPVAPTGPSADAGGQTPAPASESPGSPTPTGNAAGGAVVGQIGEVLQTLTSPTPASSTNAGAPTPKPEWTPSGSGMQTSIPIQVGLTIVTAGESPDGDLESIKRVVSADSDGMAFSFDSKTKYFTVNTTRKTRASDIDHSRQFFPDFCNGSPPKYYASNETPVQGEHAGTTTLEVSRDVLAAVKSQGTANMTFWPSTFCMAMAGTAPMQKIGGGGVPIILNDKPVAVAAIHIHGGQPSCLKMPAPIRFGCYDLWVLDDPNNPLVLRFTIEAEEMQVIKVSQAGPQLTNALASTLEAEKSADLYGIYFDFNQATIRPQSEPTLAAIAQLLSQHPQWRLEIDGHTDSIGSAAYNLTLSRQRAESVKAVLVSKYHIASARLTTGGFGATRPKATNATLEGRALNRRVELTRK
jgi:outer membrane protein OmpA-like peptidoglycan-associated protein